MTLDSEHAHLANSHLRNENPSLLNKRCHFTFLIALHTYLGRLLINYCYTSKYICRITDGQNPRSGILNLLKSIENGEWKSVDTLEEEKERYQEYAANTVRKDKRIRVGSGLYGHPLPTERCVPARYTALRLTAVP